MRVLVIAEPGGTAQGDYDTMLRLIRTAKECGADVWKPQFTTNAARHLERRSAHLSDDEKAEFYAKYGRAYSWLQWPVAWHRDFANRCGQLGMAYGCSVCLPQDVAFVAPWVDYLKISSFEAGDIELQEACFNSFVTTIISCGMGASVDPFALGLHCVSAYPAPLTALNLSVISAGFVRGYSDHSKHPLAGSFAACCGAQIVETHYRLDDCDPHNPDYAVAFTPAEFTQYVQNIRDAELMLGDGIPKVQPCEQAMLKYKVTA